MLWKLVALALQFFIGFIMCYHVILERAENLYTNDKYLENGNIYIKRYSRKTPYYLNVNVTTKQTWDNNVTIIIDIKEKLSNMYKPTFVIFRFGLCDLVHKDHIFGTMIRKSNLVCPTPAGNHNLMNMTVLMEDFPNVSPLEKGRGDVSFIVTATKEPIYKGNVYFSLIKNQKNHVY